MTRLREEILGKVGNSRRPDYDDIRDMKYLRAVINGQSLHITLPPLSVNPMKQLETLRLYPVV